MSPTIHTFEAVWNDIPLTMSWEPNWLNLEFRAVIATAHLRRRSRDNVPLPITQTGYRSHFTSSAAVTSAGEPVANALAWLTAKADTPEWRAREALTAHHCRRLWYPLKLVIIQ